MRRRRGDDLPVEWIDATEPSLDAPAEPSTHRRASSFRLILAAGVAAVLAVLAVLALLVSGRSGGHGRAAPAPVTLAPIAQNVGVQTTSLGRPLLAVPPGWELFGRGSQLVRVRLGIGRIVRTLVPPLQSTGPVFFVVGPDRAVIRPLDFVPGYVVPDGRPAQLLTGLLDQGGPVLPGPDPNHLWVSLNSGQRGAMVLVGLDGTATGVSMTIGDGYPFAADGTGGVLVSRSDGVYLARPAGLTLVSSGYLLAVGATRWLSVVCDPQRACTMVLTDRTSGSRRSLGPAPTPPQPAPLQFGLVSPDAATAAVIRDSPTGRTLQLVELTSGRERPVPVQLGSGDASQGDMVWSPDSRWLFVVNATGQIQALNRAEHRLRDLGIELPPVTQLALRVTSP